MRALIISNHVAEHIHHHLQPYDEYFWEANTEVHIDQTHVIMVDKKRHLAPLRLSFVDEKAQKYLQEIKNNQPLLKAFNIKPNPTAPIKIIDLTAGLGQDSFILSTLKKPLISIEKNPLTAAILQTLVFQYLEVYPSDWTVIHQCSHQWLSQQKKPCASHIYLDPFFHKKKSALPKNTMQWTQSFSHKDNNISENKLLDMALAHACERVIVKRDKKANYIHDKKPNQGSIQQKTSRFDCYKP